MNSIILFLNKDQAEIPGKLLISLGGIVDHGTLDDIKNATVRLKNNKYWLMTVRKANELFEEYDEHELSIIKAHLDDPLPFLIEWSVWGGGQGGVDLLQNYLNSFSNEISVWLDNGYGIIEPLQELLKHSIIDWLYKRKTKDDSNNI